MKKIQIVELKVLVPTGTPAELVGDFPHYLGEDGLDPDRFTARATDPELWNKRQGIAAWPTEPVEKNLWLVNYTGEYFESYKAVYDRLLYDEYSLANFPELCAITGKAAELWDMGVRVAVSTSPDSFWRHDGGALYIPYLRCDPDDRGLHAGWVHGWCGRCWFVVGGK